MMPTVPRSLVPAAAAVLLALPHAAGAQERPKADTVPTTMLPPAGMCRIWMTGVPASQQPAPTDCVTALRQRPANGVVLYGPARRESSSRRFDPRVGGRDSLERAIAEEKARRERDDRIRRFREMAEREQRTRAGGTDRDPTLGPAMGVPTGVGNARSATTNGAKAPAAKGGASPAGTSASAKAPDAPPPAKPPAEPKKPE